MTVPHGKLARRLIASHRWRWMPGMRAIRPGAWAEPDAVRPYADFVCLRSDVRPQSDSDPTGNHAEIWWRWSAHIDKQIRNMRGEGDGKA